MIANNLQDDFTETTTKTNNSYDIIREKYDKLVARKAADAEIQE